MTSACVAAEPVDFAKQIAPILEQHCLGCHSANIRKGEVSLATIGDLSEKGFVIAANPDGSHLLDLVTSKDGSPPEMPKEGTPLTADEVSLLRQWIGEEAAWPEGIVLRERPKADATWWSLQPLPQSFAHNSIDGFLRAKLTEQGLTPNPPADRCTLIRRATYDLTGLPPSPEEVDAFVNDDDSNAYENLIDRLLESPHYGERWGRHWLDVVRFAESIGYERNVIIDNLWPFRDYVIRSINDDKPFDQFIREHLAGDVIGMGNPDVAIGSAFLVAGPYDDVGNQDAAQAEQIRANTMDEIIRATSEAFLGLTIGCARCHDHKFDPITQQDYYGLYATFSGIRHGAAELATSDALAERDALLKPLQERKAALKMSLDELRVKFIERGWERLAEHEAAWPRPAVARAGTEESFDPVVAKFVRLVCEAQDVNPDIATGFRIDEFEVWTDEPESRNVALAANGGKATGQSRQIEDFPNAYGPQLAIDGALGATFIAAGTDLTIELAQPVSIRRIVFSSARREQSPEQTKFVFVAEYRLEVSDDGINWREIASGRDRQPVNREGHLDRRLLERETTVEERAEQTRIAEQMAAVNHEIAAIPAVPSIWIGQRSTEDARGPFHIFLGGSPQKKGSEVTPASLQVLARTPLEKYQLPAETPEADRRRALADWVVRPENPLTPRVLANRLWHYHFGKGIVDSPNDFGYMGGKPTHPELLDFLAGQLIQNGWRLKPLHRLIMLSDAYRQSSAFHDDAAAVDGDARYLWRFPPRRLSAEEVRDTILAVSGKLDPKRGGPGFRLYRFMQDNVCTYVPLDQHGPETYRRAVYHQNARASVVDLMTDFDQPDCTMSVARRDVTTTPLQALTMLNHNFTLEMAGFLAERLTRECGTDPDASLRRVYQLCYSRQPTDEELTACRTLIASHGLKALCRVLLNTSELIHVQ